MYSTCALKLFPEIKIYDLSCRMHFNATYVFIQPFHKTVLSFKNV